MQKSIIIFILVSFVVQAQEVAKQVEYYSLTIMMNGDLKTIEVPLDERQPEAHKKQIELYKNKAQLTQAQQDENQRQLKEYARRHLEKLARETEGWKAKRSECNKLESLEKTEACEQDFYKKVFAEMYLRVQSPGTTVANPEKSCFDKFLDTSKEYICEEEISFSQANGGPGKPMKLSDIFAGQDDEMKEYVSLIKRRLDKFNNADQTQACNESMNTFLKVQNGVITPKGQKNFLCDKVDSYKKNCKVSEVTELIISGPSGQSCGPGVPVCQMAYSCDAGEYKGNGNTLCAKNGDAACDTISVEDCIAASKKFDKIKSSKKSESSSSSKGITQ